MITFEQALKIVLDAAGPDTLRSEGRCEYVSLKNCYGRILQQKVIADRDMPPFDKSAVDGYACRYEDLITGIPLHLLETVPAGEAAKYKVSAGTCSKLMTGAAIPEGADYVLMVEDAREEEQTIRCNEKPDSKNNICPRGEDLLAGTEVLTPGLRIKPQDVAVLAAMGCSKVIVSKKVCAGVISTGDELTEPYETPSSVQIRNSNSWQLLAQLKKAGVQATYYGIAKDRTDSLHALLSAAFDQNQVVIVSGGVSMGDFDIVPQVVQSLGIQILFDRVAVQPGKPTTFGLGNNRFFFGLPGNPVSSFIQFELMVKPFLMKLMGSHYAPVTFRLPIAHDFSRKHPERMAHLPAEIDQSGRCTLLRYNGSGHISSLHDAQCLIRIPIGVTHIRQGEPVELILL